MGRFPVPSLEVVRVMKRLLSCLLPCLILTLPAAAEVADSGDHGFTCRTELTVAAPPARVYEALTAEIDRWWDPAHTWSGDSGNLFLEARAGGIFGENLPSGGTVQHLAVLYADPGKLLRLGGGLGPLQGMAVTGSLTIELEPRAGGGTDLRLTYAVGGYAGGGLAGLAVPVDGVLAGQMAKLAEHLAP